MLTDYEILLLLDPELADERQTEIVSRIREQVTKGGGEWAAEESWGRRRLAYEIDHKGEGHYHLLTFTAEPEALEEITRVLKITDGVLRHLATRRVKRGPGQPLAVGGPSREDAADTIDSPSGEEE